MHKVLLRILLVFFGLIQLAPPAYSGELINAAKSGNYKKTRDLVSAQSLKERTEDGKSALHLAAFMGHQKIVKLLLSAGADVNLQDVDGATALHKACHAFSPASVKILLDNGADPNITTKSGILAIHNAAGNGDIEAIKLLLNKGAVIKQDKNGDLPTHWAAYYGRPETVWYLQPKASKNYMDANVVRALQVKLRNMGYYKGTADGEYNLSTISAVNHFQKDFGSKIDGKISKTLLDDLVSSHKLDPKGGAKFKTNVFFSISDLFNYCGWDGSNSTYAVEGELDFAIDASGKRRSLAGHFRMGNLDINGNVTMSDDGMFVKRDTEIHRVTKGKEF